jgi:NAD(P)-dependent dehydrogenase (short-subunit alcohol dehydrogenase family)
MSSAKTIVITGGTGGIGYQEALWLAGMKEKHTIVITGRNEITAAKAVEAIKTATKNPNIHFAIADMSVKAEVHALGNDLMTRFPKIDELINNAGNLTVGERTTTVDGLDTNFSVNVVAPLLLTRQLVPALKAATPTGKVQITSGGIPTDTLDVDDIESKKKPVGIPAYSHSKRVMEAMAIALSRELANEGIVVNVVGGALPGATAMTHNISLKDMPWFAMLFYPCFRAFMRRDDEGRSAKACAKPCVLAALASADELGTGNSYMSYPKKGTFKKEVIDGQDAVMTYIASKL